MSAPKKARDLVDGDLIDLKQHPWHDEWDETTRTVAEYEYARVGGRPNRQIWLAGTFLLVTSQGVFPTDPDTLFDVEGVDR